MKLLIDIPEHVYEHSKEGSEDSRDEFDAMRAIANGSQQESCSEIPNTCEDAISRQAAIRAIEALQRPIMREESNYYQFKFSGMSEALGAVENLPSVTPQQRKTQMLDESNFDVNQYEMDLQSAYDCGRASTQQRTGRWIGAEVLDKIRAEIDQYLFQNEFGSAYRKEVSQIIDKYKVEREDKE